MKPPPDFQDIDPLKPDPDLIRHAALLINNGGVIGIPTTCLYGLGADALNQMAVDRLFEIKQRPAGKPILVLIHQPDMVHALVRKVPASAIRIMDAFWPGGVTLVFEAVNGLPPNLTAGTGKIGVRCCRHPVSRALAKAVGGPVTGTSANLAGQPGCATASDLHPEVANQLDLILDAGTLKGGAGSTVIDVTSDGPRVLRQGIVPAADIYAVLDENRY